MESSLPVAAVLAEGSKKYWRGITQESSFFFWKAVSHHAEKRSRKNS